MESRTSTRYKYKPIQEPDGQWYIERIRIEDDGNIRYTHNSGVYGPTDGLDSRTDAVEYMRERGWDEKQKLY